MESSTCHHEGQRLSLKGQACTVRYVGTVGGKGGDWLGVEWDDPQRGKHNGTHEGRRYFSCRSKSPTAASFVRPSQSWDQPRTFLQALTTKYISAATHDTSHEIVYISGKQAEEVGFSKFSERQAKLQGIHVLVLDRMRIQHANPAEDELRTITELCAEITTLDLSGNLFESFEEIVGLCGLLPKLHTLTLGGDRFRAQEAHAERYLPGVRRLSLSGTLLASDGLTHVLCAFPALEQLAYTSNEISDWTCPILCPKLRTIDLSNNDFTALTSIRGLEKQCPNLQTLLLPHNRISSIGPEPAFPPSLHDLSIAHNEIKTWNFFSDLSASLPSVRDLRVTGNPLYTDLRSAEGKPLTTADGYMLTIARLPQLETLNYSAITEKERLNAETYYLGQVAAELGRATEGDETTILASHPRYRELCEEYGEPNIQRWFVKEELDPRSLAARLVSLKFDEAEQISPQVERQMRRIEMSQSFDIYAVLGLLGKELGVSPLSIKLVLETEELNPMVRDSAYSGPEPWDSSDEGEDGPDTNTKNWAKREVELVPSTRPIGTYVDGRQASIRVKLK